MKVSIRALLGDKYKEGMTMEEIEAALSEIEVQDEAAMQEITRLKASISKSNTEAKDWKTKYQSTLTEAEQRETARTEELANLKKELSDMKQSAALSGYKSKYLALGYSEELATATAEALLNGDYDTVFANQQKAIDLKIAEEKKKILKQTPAPDGGNGKGGVTKEKFKEMSLAEKQQLATSDPTLYQSLTQN